jgi:hypothetical protein
MKENMVTELKRLINHYSLQAVNEATNELNSLDTDTYYLLPNNPILLEDFFEEADMTVDTLLKDLKKEVDSNRDNTPAIFNVQEYRLRFVVDFLLRKSYWYSYIKTGAALDVDKAYIIFNSEKDAEGRSDYIDTNAFLIEDIPAYHSFCNCEVTYDKEKAGEKNGDRD